MLVTMVAWALPTIIAEEKARLKFWVWLVGKVHAMAWVVDGG